MEPPTQHATKLALTVQPPAQAGSGVSLAPPPAVQLQDDQGAAVSQAGVAVSVAIASGGGSLTGATTVNTSAAGLATFTGLAIRGTAGARSLSFTAPDLTGVTSGTIDLAAGPAALLTAGAGDQQTAAPGTPVAIPPSVRVTDAENNPVAGVAVGFQVTAEGGTVDPGTVSTNSDGVAAVTSWTLGPTPGPNTLTATAAAIPGSSVVFTATASADVATITGTITLSNRLLARTGPALISATSRARAAAKSRPLQAHQFRSRTLGRPARSAPNELIVTYRPASLGAPATGSRALASRSLAAAVIGAIRTHVQAHLLAQASAVAGVSPTVMAARVRVRSPGDIAGVAAALRSDPAVATVERNGLVFRDAASLPTRFPNDHFYPQQAWHYGMIDLPEAWTITTGSAGVLVGVVDDGIRFDHPDIAANLTSDGYDFVSNDFTACSGDGVDRAGDGDGYDSDPTVPAVCDGGTDSLGGHGLHVAGTIGAVGNNGLGTTGLNWTVKIRPVRVLDIDGSGTDYDVAQGILYAAGLPADDGNGGTVQAPTGVKVINMSLGGPTTSKVIHDAVIAATNAGTLIVAAAGNEGTADPQYPAAFPEVLSVSAVGPDGELASYSSFGPTVDIAAPGGDINDGDATFGVASLIWDFKAGAPAYAFADGTSMATPHVTGVAALLLSQNPGLSAADLRSRLTGYAVDAGASGRDDKYGAGIVNARNSLTQTLAPTRQLYARLYDAATGGIVQTVAAASRSYTFSGVTRGSYDVFAGEDENADGAIGLPGRRWGGFGGSATPTEVKVTGAGTHRASFSIGRPAEQEPNDRSSDANILVIGGNLTGDTSPTDNDSYRVQIPLQGQYTFETFPVDGACGFALEEDTVIGVFDAQGTALGSNDDIDQAANHLCSRVTLTLAPGRYRVDVQGLNGGSYRVQVRAGP